MLSIYMGRDFTSSSEPAGYMRATVHNEAYRYVHANDKLSDKLVQPAEPSY